MMCLKASMWPQDWAQISFRSETLYNWFDSDPERGLSKVRSADQVILAQYKGCPMSKISSSCIEFLLPKAFPIKILINSFFVTTSKIRIKVIWCKEWIIEAQIHFVTPCILSSNQQILFFSFCRPSSCLIVKPIMECFWLKANLRPVLGSHRSLWGHH